MKDRIIGRRLARPLTEAEIECVAGGDDGNPGPPIDTAVRTNVSPQGDWEKQPDPRTMGGE